MWFWEAINSTGLAKLIMCRHALAVGDVCGAAPGQ